MAGSQGVGENMVLGMHIEILFAKIGYLANPQAKVSSNRLILRFLEIHVYTLQVVHICNLHSVNLVHVAQWL